ncbi:DUF2255 family protein [Micromonospora sp. DT81.3]|uniref:DUF2255 family protein n=1 Tax=Micromonospora sp. DT81.3 TaxID=3416523 RepID=UPI003CF6A951
MQEDSGLRPQADSPSGPTWSPQDLRHLDGLRELEISVPPADGVPGRWTPIWVVVADDEVFVRTWHRRNTGWYGRAVASGSALIRMRGEPVHVIVTATGSTDADAVDASYRAKYGAAGAQSMLTAEAVASTLRLAPRPVPTITQQNHPAGRR